MKNLFLITIFIIFVSSCGLLKPQQFDIVHAEKLTERMESNLDLNLLQVEAIKDLNLES
jgi:hypothetical protein